ncbi:hypothetical protein FB45DRAFT_1000447 [Roridomyces roridus]|uniref:Uncharacterized protein n=1 Tax=Roridomyces roridus TaxID=1738132 RepID=A0AAD7FWU1_9AGAR|nr:hypothetical protein FB45DRAFT_1000447 [Roridomyces roridus]
MQAANSLLKVNDWSPLTQEMAMQSTDPLLQRDCGVGAVGVARQAVTTVLLFPKGKWSHYAVELDIRDGATARRSRDIGLFVALRMTSGQDARLEKYGQSCLLSLSRVAAFDMGHGARGAGVGIMRKTTMLDSVDGLVAVEGTGIGFKTSVGGFDEEQEVWEMKSNGVMVAGSKERKLCLSDFGPNCSFLSHHDRPSGAAPMINLTPLEHTRTQTHPAADLTLRHPHCCPASFPPGRLFEILSRATSNYGLRPAIDLYLSLINQLMDLRRPLRVRPPIDSTVRKYDGAFSTVQYPRKLA